MAKNEEVDPPSAEAELKAEAGSKAEAETAPVAATPVVAPTPTRPRSRRGLVVGVVIGGALLWSALAFGGGFVAGSQLGDDILPGSSQDAADDSQAGPGDGRGPGGFRPHFGNGDRPGGPDRDRQGDTTDSDTDSDTIE